MTVEQLAVGLWISSFLMLSDSSEPPVSVTTPHFKTDTPRGAQVGGTTFAVYIMWVLVVNVTSVSV